MSWLLRYVLLALLVALGLAMGATWLILEPDDGAFLRVQRLAQNMRQGAIWVAPPTLLGLVLLRWFWDDTAHWSGAKGVLRRLLAGGVMAIAMPIARQLWPAAGIIWPHIAGTSLVVGVLAALPWHGSRRWSGLFIAGGLVALSGWGWVEIKRHRLIPRGAPNLVLISIDTLRWDHVGAYGYPRPTTPNLDALAKGGMVFQRAWTPSNWTLPSMASILTGVLPLEHQAFVQDMALRPHLRPLAKVLRDHGYDTAGVVSNPFVGSERGFARGFRLFDETLSPQAHGGPTSVDLTRIAKEFLPQLREPYFLWVHYIDPHYDYLDHPDIDWALSETLPSRISNKFLKAESGGFSDADRQYIIDLYDEEILYTDRAIGALADAVDAGGHSTILAVVSDHGEGFGEHGRYGHGRDLYDDLVRAPLIIGGDVPQHGVVTTPVEARWLYDSMLAWAGIAPSDRDLLEIGGGQDPEAVIPLLGNPAFDRGHAWVGATDGDHKVVLHLDEERLQAFDLRTDPGESLPIDVDQPGLAPLVEATRQMAKDFAYPGKGQVDLDEDDISALRALGYVD